MKEANTQGNQSTGQRDNICWCARREDVGYSRGVAPFVLNLDSRWRSLASFTPWSLYPQGKRPTVGIVWALEPVRTLWGRVKSFSLTRNCNIFLAA